MLIDTANVCVCGASGQPVAGMFPSFAAASLPSDRSSLKWAAPSPPTVTPDSTGGPLSDRLPLLLFGGDQWRWTFSWAGLISTCPPLGSPRSQSTYTRALDFLPVTCAQGKCSCKGKKYDFRLSCSRNSAACFASVFCLGTVRLQWVDPVYFLFMSLHEQKLQHAGLLHNKQWADAGAGYLLFSERAINGTCNGVFDSKTGRTQP